jgi:hypothetical protein
MMKWKGYGRKKFLYTLGCYTNGLEGILKTTKMFGESSKFLS